MEYHRTYFIYIERNFIGNKTGTRQYTRAVWSTFAEIHPGSLIHCLGLPEFPIRIYDALHITAHTRRI